MSRRLSKRMCRWSGRDTAGSVDKLAIIPLFAGCSERELRRVVTLTTEVHALGGQTLLREGCREAELLIIRTGTATVSVHGYPCRTLGPGSYIGEVALFNHGHQDVTVTADSDMTLIAMSEREFEAMTRMAPTATRNLAAGLASQLQTMHARNAHPSMARTLVAATA